MTFQKREGEGREREREREKKEKKKEKLQPWLEKFQLISIWEFTPYNNYTRNLLW